MTTSEIRTSWLGVAIDHYESRSEIRLAWASIIRGDVLPTIADEYTRHYLAGCADQLDRPRDHN